MKNFRTILEEEAVKNGLGLWSYLEEKIGVDIKEERRGYNIFNEIITMINRKQKIRDIKIKKNILYIAISNANFKKKFGHDFIYFLKKTKHYIDKKYVEFFGKMKWTAMFDVKELFVGKDIKEIKKEIINIIETDNRNIVIKSGWIYIPLCNDRFKSVLNTIDRNDRDVCIKNVHIPDMGVTQRCIGVYCDYKNEQISSEDIFKKLSKIIEEIEPFKLKAYGIYFMPENKLVIMPGGFLLSREFGKNYMEIFEGLEKHFAIEDFKDNIKTYKNCLFYYCDEINIEYIDINGLQGKIIEKFKKEKGYNK